MTETQLIERIVHRIEDYLNAVDLYYKRKAKVMMRAMLAKRGRLFKQPCILRKKHYAPQLQDGISERIIIERLAFRIEEYNKQLDKWERSKTDTDLRYMRTMEANLREACSFLRRRGYVPRLTDGVNYQRLKFE